MTGPSGPVIISSMIDLETYARERFEFNKQKQTLLEQQQQRLSVTHNGGLFRVTMTLINWLHVKQDLVCILPDSYDTPVEINCAELLALCESRWNEVHNDWYNEYQLLRTKRKAGDVEV